MDLAGGFLAIGSEYPIQIGFGIYVVGKGGGWAI